jgi:hypothetical protein
MKPKFPQMAKELGNLPAAAAFLNNASDLW